MEQNGTSDTAHSAYGYQSGLPERERTSARTLAIVAIVVAVTVPFWEGPLLATINIRMPLASDLADNVRALDKLDHRTSDLEKQLGEVTTQLAKVQTQLTETSARATTAVDRTTTLAMVELVTALRRPGGFQMELAALRKIAGNPADLKPLFDQIEPYSATGVPTTTQLRQEFSRINSRLQWSGGLLSVAWVTRLLPWQHSANAAQPAPADNTPKLLDQASAQITGGDLAAAVTTLQSVPSQHQDALADWLEDAKARVAADAVVQRLSDQIDQGASKPAVAQKKA